MVFAAILLVRLIAWALAMPLQMSGDEMYYLHYAQKLLSHTYLTGTGGYEETYLLPLWPNVLVLFLHFWNSVSSARLFTVCIASCNGVLFYFIVEKFIDRRTALLSAWIYAIFPEHVAFSHYLYAEILTETFILGFVWMAFQALRSENRSRWLQAAFLWLGIGVLCKHFMVVPYMAFLIVLLGSKYRAKFVRYGLISLLFFIPPAIYFSWLGFRGQDALKFINVPIKNANEFQGGGWFHFKGRTRSEVIDELVEQKKEMPTSAFLKKAMHNFYGLWSPNSYPIARLFRHYRIDNPWPLIFLFELVYVFIMGGMILQVCLGLSSEFRTFVIANLAILSSMGVVWWMVSRYRVPFLFLFIMCAARTVTRWKEILIGMHNRKRVGAAVILLVLLLHMTWWSFGVLGSWT